jgi:hypothetical protein
MKHPFALPNKYLGCLFVVLLLAHGAAAQETIALDEAQKIAAKLAAVPTASSDLPFAVEIDAEKPVGIKGDDAGLIILPDKRLSADALANAGKTITPVAQLWTYKVNFVTNGVSVENSRLRTLTIGDGDKTRYVQLFLVGVAKNEQGATELVIFGKGSEPVLRAPLTKASGGKQELPIEVSGRKAGEGAAALTLSLSGQYTAELTAVKVND